MASLDHLVIVIRRLVEKLDQGAPAPDEVFSGFKDVSSVTSSLPSNAIARGVLLQLDASASVPVSVVANADNVVGEGPTLNPGEKYFFPVSNTDRIRLVATLPGYTTVRVFWWAT